MRQRLWTKVIMTILTAFLLLQQTMLTVYANNIEFTDCSKLMEATITVNATKEPDANAEVITTFEKGTPIMVTGESQSGWYRITFQGQVGYITMDSVKIATMVEGESLEALDRELEEMEQTNKIIVEEVERMREEHRRSVIWTTVIAVLVVGILATGIYSTIKANREEENGEESKEESEDKNEEI